MKSILNSEGDNMGKLFLTTGDYIKNAYGMDAIVDAQNKYMGVGGNICGLILSAAGRNELLNYCKENFKENMYPSEVRVTPGFKLNMDIIHVLAPVYKEEENPFKIMQETYINLVNTIKQKKYKKVMICGLGTGSHGYNAEDIAYDVMKILSNFAEKNDVELYFNSMYPLMKDVYLKAFFKIKNYNYGDFDEMTLNEKKALFKKYNLYDINIKEKYDDFVFGRNYGELGLSEKMIYTQYELDL